MELRQLLRNDFANYIRPLYLKDKCELCDCEENLHLHHNTHFRVLLDKVLQKLELEEQEIEAYTTIELSLVRDLMLAEQVKINYVTCCASCHLDLHSGSFKYNLDKTSITHFKYKPKEEQIRELNKDDIKTLHQKLSSMVGEKYVGKKDLNSVATHLNLMNVRQGSSEKFLCTSLNSINEVLNVLNLPYEIESCRRSIRVDGKPKKLTFYTVVKTEQEE